MKEVQGVCRYCGQTSLIQLSEAEIKSFSEKEEFRDMTESQIAENLATIKAARLCKCEGANAFRKQEIRRNFEGFVKGDVVNFMDQYDLEEISIVDGYGNKAKLKKKESGQIEVTKTIKDVM